MVSMETTNRRLVNALETLVVAVILLVLVQNFLEDFSVVAGWQAGERRTVELAGFFFDLFFTVEFLVRLYYALMNRRAAAYITRERGWIDFLASVPLLMFSSGPYAAAVLTGGTTALGMGGLLNLLKVIKAIRIARILRFLRVIKLFRRIKNVSSPMAQRHVASITAISISVLVLALLGFTVLTSSLEVPGLDTAFDERQERIAALLAERTERPGELVSSLETLEETDRSLLVVRYRGRTLFSRYENDYYRRHFALGDYGYRSRGELELFFDVRPAVQNQSRQGLLFFAIVVLIVLAYLVAYGPHFALTVSDPIHVMKRGLGEPDYNLEVKIPPAYSQDDVYQLASLYNESFLPMKDRSAPGAERSVLDLGAEDLRSLFETENR